ncbi:sulfatase [Neorhodopirellula pilleata]|uniref:Arylsulfatase n=1 Tax=Neorhodopirellula pilleata TaxID=2714738 RepID=A0A5C6APF1_9BACT|nr:sulfatase [Neorhodopirellula pilleata]TWU01387.1 Arylsulfatase [Neorhodopirellula pilleata]
MKPVSNVLLNVFVICWLCVSISAAESTAPNILFILTDDQGWATLSCYGSQKVPTPHLDRLASEGVRFTDAYVMPQCTPTRAALLTGQHTARSGMWHVIPWYGQPWARMTEPAYREQLPREWPILPKVLRDHGYSTGMAGKWHLTNNADGNYVELKDGNAYGFDFVASRGPGSQNEGDKWVDHLTDSAIGFIREHKDKPWFFYLAHHTLHGVVSAPAELVEKHRDAGTPETGMFNSTYLAAIEHLDNSIGRLMAALDDMQQRENTIVVFLSDNGGVDTVYHIGSETLTINRQEFDNAPLRAGKGSPYEGGIRVPCILRWPASVHAGQTISTPVHVTDWMPTLLAAAGCSEAGIPDCDGTNLVPLLQGERIPERPLYFHMPLYDLRWAVTPCAVIREGDWKLIEHFGDSFDVDARYQRGRKLELFNLRTDLGESRNLSDAESDRADAMRFKLHAWLESIPTPIPAENSHFDPHKQFDETKVKQAWNR